MPYWSAVAQGLISNSPGTQASGAGDGDDDDNDNGDDEAANEDSTDPQTRIGDKKQDNKT